MKPSRIVLASLLLFALSDSALARKQPVLPPRAAGGAAVGIEIALKGLLGMPAGNVEEVFFVRIDPEHGLTQNEILSSDVVKSGRAYLLNAAPGDYAVVALSYYESGGKLLGALQPGGMPPFVTYFSRELAEATRVSVSSGELVFAGSFRLDLSGRMSKADAIQEFYALQLPVPKSFQLLGKANQSSRDDTARRAFLTKARADLASGGWTELVLAALDSQPKPTAVASAAGAPVSAALALLDRVEGVTRGGRPTHAEIERVSKDLFAWLKSHPDDAEVLIVSARVMWMENLLEPMVLNPGEGKPPDPALSFEPAHRLLDRAIALQPQNAEAHYWKARLYGVIVPDFSGDALEYRPVDGEQAVVFGRKAVALAPADTQYAATLAQYLAGRQESQEAMRVLAASPGGQRHPLYTLLHDFDILPLPEKAVYERTAARNVAMAQAERGELADYRYERVRAYVIPAPAGEVEAFYKKHWPQFQLGKGETSNDGVRMTAWQFALRLSNDTWKPERSMPRRTEDVMVGVLTELRDVPPEARKKMPAEVGDLYCMLLFVDYRVLVP